MSTTASPTVNYAPAAAPYLLGALLNWGLFGVLSVQVYLYHLSFPGDKWTIKSLVYFVYLVDMAQTFVVTHDIFSAYAKHYGKVGELSSVQLEPIALPLLSSIVGATVQLYYAHRIGILFGSKWLTALVSVPALTASVSGLVTVYQALSVATLSELVRSKSINTGVWWAGEAACDITIAVLMAYLLLKHNGESSRTYAIVQRLIRLVVETNMLTAIAASTGVILFYAFPHGAYHRCPATILAKLYSNSMLAVFNSRIRIAGGRDWASDSNLISVDTRGGNLSTVGPISFARAAETVTSSSGGANHVEGEVWSSEVGPNMQPSGSIMKHPDLAAEAV